MKKANEKSSLHQQKQEGFYLSYQNPEVERTWQFGPAEWPLFTGN